MTNLGGNGTCTKCGLDFVAQLGFRACSCMVVHKPKKIEDMNETEAIAAALKYKLLNKVMYDALKEAGRHHQGFHSEIGTVIREVLKQVDMA